MEKLVIQRVFHFLLIFILSSAFSSFLSLPCLQAGDTMLSLSDPAKLPVLDTVPAGYPDPKMTLTPDAFQTPPEGFGEVPFWWWSGDKLDKDRLAWQIRELHEKGVTGMQINYAHKDTSQPHWPTFPNTPEIFTPEWWDFWAFAAEECGKYGMGIGLSTYTLDWTGTENLFNRIVYEDPAFHTRTLHLREVTDGNFTPSENSIGFWAYPFRGNVLTGKGIQLSTEDPAQTASENVREMLAKAGNADFDSV
ncbi:MAG: hypothetical protein E7028_00795, partial [Planctomycetaceae bacterium]|nr:hypothetical protein [Planctomycetaceae bacterium]